jgi:hypothetical protein
MAASLDLDMPAAKRMIALLAIAVACCWSTAPQARPANCSTTDDGNYACDFRPTGTDGSFQISAPSKPTYILNMEEPGVASGYLGLGGRNTPLPGRYLRSKTEPGCWINSSTRAKICAR